MLVGVILDGYEAAEPRDEAQKAMALVQQWCSPGQPT